MKIIKQTTIGLFLAFSALMTSAASVSAGSQLQHVAISGAAAGGTSVHLDFTRPVHIPQGFVLENPPRLVFDLPGVQVMPGARRNNSGAGSVKSVYSANNKGMARVVIEFNHFSDYTIEPRGDDLVMVFDPPPHGATVPSLPTSQNVANVQPGYDWYRAPGAQANRQQGQQHTAQQQQAHQFLLQLSERP